MLLKMNGAPISAKFGALDSVHSTPHTGVDIPLAEGTPLRAIADGVVERLTDYGHDNIGRGVILRLDNGSTAIYGHLKGFTVKVGQHIHSGQTIGYSGNTGASTGPHLHLGLMQNGHFIDPTKYADAAIAKKPGTLEGIRDGLDAIREGIHDIGEFIKWLGHWLNPHTWWDVSQHAFQSGAVDTPLIVATIAGLLLWAFGFKFHKKYLLLAWIIFWILRAGVFRL